MCNVSTLNVLVLLNTVGTSPVGGKKINKWWNLNWSCNQFLLQLQFGWQNFRQSGSKINTTSQFIHQKISIERCTLSYDYDAVFWVMTTIMMKTFHAYKTSVWYQDVPRNICQEHFTLSRGIKSFVRCEVALYICKLPDNIKKIKV